MLVYVGLLVLFNGLRRRTGGLGVFRGVHLVLHRLCVETVYYRLLTLLGGLLSSCAYRLVLLFTLRWNV